MLKFKTDLDKCKGSEHHEYLRTVKIAQWGKMLASNPDDLSFTPRTHMG